jgi:hypothetical protein
VLHTGVVDLSVNHHFEQAHQGGPRIKDVEEYWDDVIDLAPRTGLADRKSQSELIFLSVSVL